MSLYSDYLAATGRAEIIETDKSFVTYHILGKECYIEDVYVAPEARLVGECRRLGDMITALAQRNKCEYLTTTVNANGKSPTTGISAALAFGFKFMRSTDKCLYFYKELA